MLLASSTDQKVPPHTIEMYEFTTLGSLWGPRAYNEYRYFKTIRICTNMEENGGSLRVFSGPPGGNFFLAARHKYHCYFRLGAKWMGP